MVIQLQFHYSTCKCWPGNRTHVLQRMSTFILFLSWNTPNAGSDFFCWYCPRHLHALGLQQADLGRLQHKCNRLRLLATCSITITNKQNNNVIDYDYIESNHDDIYLETFSERKQKPICKLSRKYIFRQHTIWINAICNLQGLSTGKKKNHINCWLRFLCRQQTSCVIEVWARG